MNDLRDVHRGGVGPGEQRSVTALPLVGLVRLYQWTISPVLGPVCRYYPSCSAYSVTALERFGPIKGSWLTARRLLRCNPFARGGVDHVPSRAHHIPDLAEAARAAGAATTQVSTAHHRH
ncbi:MAG: membrane protein insertion efficiency factor YidD [Propionibacteriaceae bacterium]|nr:membrane protein insertion efficiency factor YidD [Propionibacteriaceae bacterium]